MRSETYIISVVPPLLEVPLSDDTVIATEDEAIGEWVDPNQVIGMVKIEVRAMNAKIAHDAVNKMLRASNG